MDEKGVPDGQTLLGVDEGELEACTISTSFLSVNVLGSHASISAAGGGLFCLAGG